MTVKELKLALKDVPDDTEIRAQRDGVHCERTDVWWASYNDSPNNEDENEDNNGEFIINC